MFTDNNRNLKIPVLNVIIILCVYLHVGLPGGSVAKNLPAMQETQVSSLGWEDALEEGMATHSSTLA